MKKDMLIRSLIVIVPLLAFLCGTGASIYEWQRLKRLEGESTATRTSITQIIREMQGYQAQPLTEKYPTVEKTPREQAQFLDSLRRNADSCKVQIVRWLNVAPPANASSSSTANGEKSSVPQLPTGVSSIVSILEVTGQSENARQFMFNIHRSRRLLNMSDVKWVRDQWPTTHLTCTLTRYVGPAVQLPPDRGASMPAAAAAAPAPGPVLSPASAVTTSTSGAGNTSGYRINMPNPMDAADLTHKSYQHKLEAGMSALQQAPGNSTQSSASHVEPHSNR